MSSDHKIRQAPAGRRVLIYFGKLGLKLSVKMPGVGVLNIEPHQGEESVCS